jgi:translocation and assembly module TamB
VRRKTILGLLAVVILIALISVGICAWILGTPAGARWALAELSSRAALGIETEKVEGRLWDGLGLEEVTVRWRTGSFTAEKIYFQWSPLDLIYGSIAVGRLKLVGIDIQDDRPEEKKPPDFGWPRVSGLPARLSAHIERFEVKGLTYRRLRESPLRVEKISAGVIWKRGILSVKDLRADSRQGSISGSLSAGFVIPSLSLDLAATPARPAAQMDRLLVHAKLHASGASATPEGHVHVTGSAGEVKRIELTSGVALARHSIVLTDIRVMRIVSEGAVHGNGEISFPDGNPQLRLEMNSTDLDFSPLFGKKTDITGSLSLAGTTEQYSGSFDLANKGDALRTIHIAGLLSGDRERVALTGLDGSWLAGTIRGSAWIAWRKTFSFSSEVQARKLDPSLIAKEWTGEINADVKAQVRLAENKPPEAEFSARFLESMMRGKALTGAVEARLAAGNFLVERLFLKGKGFDIAAGGELGKRLGFRADITDLSGLVPGAKGVLRAEGWVRRHNKRFSGDVTGSTRGVAARGLRIGVADFNGSFSEARGYPMRLKAKIRGLIFRGLRADSAHLSIAGTTASHAIELSMRSGGAAMHARLEGGYNKGVWLGQILSLSGTDDSGAWSLAGPADLALSGKRFSLLPMVLTGTGGERLEARGELTFHPVRGLLQADWEKAKLERLSYWIGDLKAKGQTSGKISCRWQPKEPPRISGRAIASGTVVFGGKTITVHRSTAELDWSGEGLAASFEADIDEGTFVKGHFFSSVAAGTTLPEEGKIDAQLHDLDLSFFGRWIPASLNLKGKIAGNLKGRLLAGRRLDISGSASLAGGVISRHAGRGKMTASFRTAKIDFRWRDQAVTGNISLVLEEYGHATGTFDLPLPARFPLSMDRSGPVGASMNGQLHESGMLTALFPGLVQETHGDIDVDLRAGGTWKKPEIGGTMRLSKAGAYLPAGGITVKDVAFTARLAGDRIFADSFHASSGEGEIQGSAEIMLKNQRVTSYHGTVKGKEFKLIYLPELRLDGSPDLTFEGTPGKLTVKGRITIPYMLVLQGKTKTPAEPSRDVIIVDGQERKEEGMKTALDIRVKVVLGKDVTIKTEGVDARLEGAVDVNARGINDIMGRGEIHVVNGRYSAYGVSLDIERGRAVFTGGKIDRPNLDILALKKIEQVKAGVLVSGRPPDPTVKLYSDPTMADTDILAYIVLGHPLGSSNEQASLVARTAGFLFSTSQAAIFQHQLKQRLGLDTLDIESGTAGGVSRSIVTVGKYLAPNLYISYGRSLFTDSNLFRVRYDLSKHWQVQTESGNESGADIFYKIDFR